MKKTNATTMTTTSAAAETAIPTSAEARVEAARRVFEDRKIDLVAAEKAEERIALELSTIMTDATANSAATLAEKQQEHSAAKKAATAARKALTAGSATLRACEIARDGIESLLSCPFYTAYKADKTEEVRLRIKRRKDSADGERVLSAALIDQISARPWTALCDKLRADMLEAYQRENGGLSKRQMKDRLTEICQAMTGDEKCFVTGPFIACMTAHIMGRPDLNKIGTINVPSELSLYDAMLWLVQSVRAGVALTVKGATAPKKAETAPKKAEKKAEDSAPTETPAETAPETTTETTAA